MRSRSGGSAKSQRRRREGDCEQLATRFASMTREEVAGGPPERDASAVPAPQDKQNKLRAAIRQQGNCAQKFQEQA